jgi:DNA-binding beta-propeller fold protein YncE
MTMAGRYIYVTHNGSGEVSVIDIQDPLVPVIMATGSGFGTPVGVAAVGRSLYVADTAGYVRTANLGGVEASSLLAHSAAIGQLQVSTDAMFAGDLAIGGGLTVGSGGIMTSGPLTVSYTGTSAFLGPVTVNGISVCLADGTNCLSNPVWAESSADNAIYLTTSTRNVGIGTSAPEDALHVVGNIRNVIAADQTLSIQSTISLGNSPRSVAVFGKYAYVNNSIGGNINVIDVQNSLAPTVISTTTASAQYMATDGR